MIRVSTILATHGFSPDPQWFKDEHRDRGQAVHWIGEQVFRDKPAVCAPSLAGYAQALTDAKEHLGFQAVAIEERMVLDKITGRPDLIGYMPKKVGDIPFGPAIIDIKSGDPYPGHAIQLSLYEELAEKNGIRERLPEKYRDLPFWRIGLYVNPDGTYHVKVYRAPWDRAIAQALMSIVAFQVLHNLIPDDGMPEDDPETIENIGEEAAVQ